MSAPVSTISPAASKPGTKGKGGLVLVKPGYLQQVRIIHPGGAQSYPQLVRLQGRTGQGGNRQLLRRAEALAEYGAEGSCHGASFGWIDRQPSASVTIRMVPPIQ